MKDQLEDPETPQPCCGLVDLIIWRKDVDMSSQSIL